MNDKPMKALLVEDNEDDALMIQEMLSRAKGDRFDLEWAGRLSTGLERLAKGGIDVILLDLGLPDSQGLETLSRANAQAPEVPIVVLTGLEDEMLATQAMRAGAQDYLVKGQVDGNLLVRSIRHAIEWHRMLAELEQQAQELQASEKRLRTIIEKAADSIIVVDGNGIVHFVNPAAEALFGRQAEDLLGESLGLPVVAGETTELDILRTGGETATAEMRVVETMWEGESAYLASLHDITRRKRAAEALRETRDYLDSLIRHANAPIMVWDPQGRITRFNHAFEHLTGYTADEVIGQELHMLFPETNRDELLHEIAHTLSGEYWESVEIPILRKDGDVRLALWNSANTYAEDGTTLLATIAQGTDITERKRAEEEVRRHLERIEALREIDKAIISTLGLTEVLDIILEELEGVIPYHSAAIFLITDGTAKLAAGRGFSDLEHVSQVSFPVQEDALTLEVLQQKRPLVLADAQADERFLARGGTEYVRSWIDVPLIAKDRAVGFLTIDHREPGVYGEESAEMAQAFASQAAVAIENARLYEEAQQELAERKRAEEELQDSLEKLRKTLGGTIQAIASTVEIKDPYTAGHQRRMANLARAIATEMGLSKDQIDGIRMAGVTHDIGKISIPAEILSKPIKLNTFEIGIIRAHPQVGYDVLKEIDFPWPVAQIVFQHHERMDGSGYPQGLQGEDTLLEARILAVADVIEAMASHRPYRATLGIDKALEEISQNRGVLYDPAVVDTCLKLFAVKGFTLE